MNKFLSKLINSHAIGAKVTGAGQFIIELAEPEAMDLKVNWWVVN